MKLLALCAFAIALLCPTIARADPKVQVGSKKFTESVVLADLVTMLARSAGAEAVHRRELGGTQVLWAALLAGEIDVYVEYTGTIREEILAESKPRDEEAMRAELEKRGVRMTRPLGFNNTYAIGMKEAVAEARGVRTISDMKKHPDLKLGFANEFMDRKDGWPTLSQRYGLPQRDVTGLDHDLAYRGLEAGSIDAVDLYSTDAEISYYGLRVLTDDLRHFPAYDALLIYRADLAARAPAVVAAMSQLEGRISEKEMVAMNARAKLDRAPESVVAADFLAEKLGIRSDARVEGRAAQILRNTGEHLYLVGLSLLAAILLAIPLGIVAARRSGIGQVILAVVGVIQTIPSLALLVVLIPIFGLGEVPAMIALFLYSLLPIVRNTYSGLHDIPASMRESAAALGLPPFARLRLVELPMASRSILAGIKTSAVINVGTATLGAVIGAGGYGQPILTGIRLNRTDLILQGAVPAAALALLVQLGFELGERWLVPRGLRG